ncbi:MAG: ABC transporter ATP-binding protein [Pirellulales bacterium]|nr:ABC transporter ATP-binding protein [Pirellulales bacterium]
MPELSVVELTKQYPTRGEPLVVLRGVNLQLGAGENLAILGPSGSGKSTLLHILGTLEQPTSGSVRLAGHDPFALDERQQARFRNEQVGFVFQDHHLLPQCSVLENVLVPLLALGGRVTAEQLDRAKELLEKVGLTQRLDHRPAELSGGERQRVGIARALVRRPTLVLADEPTGNLDRKSAAEVADLLLAVHEHFRTILIVVTHSNELAARLSRRMELNDGVLVPIA